MLGSSHNSIEMIEYAKLQGIHTIVTDYLPPEVSRAKLHSDEYWMINTCDIDELEKKCREENVTCVVCGISEFNIEKSMELCKRLNLPHYCTPEAWSYSRDKEKFKTLCKRIGAPVATDYEVSEALTDEELAKVKYPVVVKPVDLSSNRGISYCYNADELREAYKLARSMSKSSKIIVERMFHGPEWYSYYALADGKISMIGLNAMVSQPGELANLYSLTTTITDNVEHFMKEVNPKIEEVLREVGCKEGVAWVQVMLDDDGQFYIIEMGYRLPGDLPHIQYTDMFGFNSLKWLVDYHRGIKHSPDELPAPEEHEYTRCGCSYTQWTNKEGTIKEFRGLDKIMETGDYTLCTQYHVDDKIGYHRPWGVFVFTGENADEICTKINNINSNFAVINENGENLIIQYTDFDFLKNRYAKGIAEKTELS